METINIIGFFSAFCTTVSFAPQVIKVIRTGDTASLSLLMYVIFTIGVAGWLVYGLMRRDPAMIAANGITLCLAAIILTMKIRNDVIASRARRGRV